jgi:large subunit ribosomal protein L21
MYAVVKISGKQYRVEKGESLLVDRMQASEGDKVTLDPLLFADEGNTVFEGGDLEKIKIEAVVTGHERGKKVHVLKYTPKRGYKVRTGFRADLTRLEIKDIKLLQRRAPPAKAAADEAPAAEATAEPAAKPAAKPKAAAAKKPPAKPRAPRAPKKEAEDGS